MSESEDYKRGWYDGFQAAKQAQDYPKIYPTQPLGPAKTEDIMWPDRYPTTTPFPPTMTTNRCGTCGIEMKGAWGYVCNHPNCPTRVSCNVNTLADNQLNTLYSDKIQPLTNEQIEKLKGIKR